MPLVQNELQYRIINQIQNNLRNVWQGVNRLVELTCEYQIHRDTLLLQTFIEPVNYRVWDSLYATVEKLRIDSEINYNPLVTSNDPAGFVSMVVYEQWKKEYEEL